MFPTSALSLVGLFPWFAPPAVQKAALASIWAVWGAVLQVAQAVFARILQVPAADTIQGRRTTVRAVYPGATPAHLPTHSSHPAQGRPTPIHTMTGDGRPSFGEKTLPQEVSRNRIVKVGLVHCVLEAANDQSTNWRMSLRYTRKRHRQCLNRCCRAGTKDHPIITLWLTL